MSSNRSGSPTERSLFHDAHGLLFEIFTSSPRGGHDWIAPHSGLYVRTSRWERPDAGESLLSLRGAIMHRAIDILDVALVTGAQLVESGMLAPVDLYVPGIVHGLLTTALFSMVEEHEAPVLTQTLMLGDMARQRLAPDAMRLRIIMPDHTNDGATAGDVPTWLLYLCNNESGHNVRYLGMVTRNGFLPSTVRDTRDLDGDEDGMVNVTMTPTDDQADDQAERRNGPILVRRVPIGDGTPRAHGVNGVNGANGAEDAPDTTSEAFGALRDLNPDFWSALGGQLDTL